jgi:hypothetical protein
VQAASDVRDRSGGTDKAMAFMGVALRAAFASHSQLIGSCLRRIDLDQTGRTPVADH